MYHNKQNMYDLLRQDSLYAVEFSTWNRSLVCFIMGGSEDAAIKEALSSLAARGAKIEDVAPAIIRSVKTGRITTIVMPNDNELVINSLDDSRPDLHKALILKCALFLRCTSPALYWLAYRMHCSARFVRLHIKYRIKYMMVSILISLIK